jgi:hypothetical protein
MVEFDSTEGIWSYSYIGEIFQILEKQWDCLLSFSHVLNEICVLS